MIAHVATVYTRPCNGSHQATRGIGLDTARDICHTSMLRTHGNEVMNRWVIASLDVSSQKLASLREPNSVKSHGQFWDALELFADGFNL